MNWLSSLPVGTLVLGWLALALLVAVVARLAIRALVPAAEHEHVQRIASPLMPALGAAFAIFTALTLSSEAAYLRSAENVVSDEAAAAVTPGLGSDQRGRPVAADPVGAARLPADHPRQGVER